VSNAASLATLLALVTVACRPEVRPAKPSATTARRGSVHDSGVLSLWFQSFEATPPVDSSQLVVDPMIEAPVPVREAIAVIVPTKGHHATGTVRFHEVEGGLEVFAEIANLPGSHTYQIHVHGDCSAPDAASAGPHFQFTTTSLNSDDPMLAGSIGELRDDGRLTTTHQTRIESASLQGTLSIIGRSVVVHAKGKDPAAVDGNRIGCGVIGIANPAPTRVAEPRR